MERAVLIVTEQTTPEQTKQHLDRLREVAYRLRLHAKDEDEEICAPSQGESRALRNLAAGERKWLDTFYYDAMTLILAVNDDEVYEVFPSVDPENLGSELVTIQGGILPLTCFPQSKSTEKRGVLLYRVLHIHSVEKACPYVAKAPVCSKRFSFWRSVTEGTTFQSTR